MAKIGNQGDFSNRGVISLTEKEIKEIETLSSVLNLEQTANYLGISVCCLQEICRRQPEVSVSMKRGKSRAIKNIAQGLIRKALNGDTTSAIFYLKTQAGWKETQVNEVNGSSKINVNIKTPKDIGNDVED